MFIACSMSNASSPRTSPMMMRSGRIRRLLISNCRWRIAPCPSMLGGRVSRRTIFSCAQPQFGGIFDRDKSLVLGNVLRQNIQKCRLAGAGAAGDQDADARASPQPPALPSSPAEMLFSCTS